MTPDEKSKMIIALMVARERDAEQNSIWLYKVPRDQDAPHEYRKNS
ncbi:hypothetical protein HMPREF9446_03523 [Bacteroides fluxus YIT 12057]|uniref:Uncharacterized protein n=1 Tax=Bacteroides fluxus YIT 12057 TaxID=763034 RepID=F3PXM5_9BACE|nr:hypothetical protein HMPREF9446_03523 [Bacteroides fluxus YIT 12057]